VKTVLTRRRRATMRHDGCSESALRPTFSASVQPKDGKPSLELDLSCDAETETKNRLPTQPYYVRRSADYGNAQSIDSGHEC